MVELIVKRDGRVSSKRIIKKSGDRVVDAAAQRTLDSVRFIAPFPRGDTRNQRSFKVELAVNF